MDKLTKKLLDSLDEIVVFSYTLRYSSKEFYYQVSALMDLFDNKIDKSDEVYVIMNTLRDYEFECIDNPLFKKYKKFQTKVKSLIEFYHIYRTDNYIKNTPQSIKRKIDKEEWEESFCNCKGNDFLKPLTLIKYDYESFPKEWKDKNKNDHKDKTFIYIGEVNKMKHHGYVHCLKSGKPYIFDIHNLKELTEEEL